MSNFKESNSVRLEDCMSDYVRCNSINKNAINLKKIQLNRFSRVEKSNKPTLCIPISYNHQNNNFLLIYKLLTAYILLLILICILS